MEFIKAHGTGNDFVVLIDMDDQVTLPDSLVSALCDRRMGIGADGLIRIGAPTSGGDAFMDYRNADGSVVEMCGNGVRVVAKVVADRQLLPDVSERDTLVIDTRAGQRPVTLHRHDGLVASVTVDMGAPSTQAADLPMLMDRTVGFELTEAPGRAWDAVSMGNPHAITLVDDVATAPVETLGPVVEVHDIFPKGVNVEFAHVSDRGHVDLRVWERGVGETHACGTGACATVVALHNAGAVEHAVEVRVPGGELHVEYDPDRHPSVFMTGPAEVVATIEVDDEWIGSRGRGH